MNRYRKKPVVIEAIQFKRNNVTDCNLFTGLKLHEVTIPRCIDGIMTGAITTLEGKMIVTEGDYIIRGVEGEYYPCKPNIFIKTYEKVE